MREVGRKERGRKRERKREGSVARPTSCPTNTKFWQFSGDGISFKIHENMQNKVRA